MHVSMHNWMRAEPIEVTIARLAKCGYDAIEISGEPERYDTKHVRKLLQDHGLTCWGSVTLMLADRDLLAKDEAQRAASVKYVTRLHHDGEGARRPGDHDRPVDGRQDQAAGHAGAGVALGGRQPEVVLRARPDAKASASPSSRSTASRPTS